MTKPPRLPRWILSAVLHPVDREEVLGDLEETYSDYLLRFGGRKARVWYWLQALSSAPIFFFHSFYWSFRMLSNYLKLTIRTLGKQKVQGAINIAGLSVGLALCILILIFVQNEYSYDRFHENYERIAQIQEWRVGSGGNVSGGNSNLSLPVAGAARDEIPGIDSATRFENGDVFLRVGDTVFKEQAGFVDPAFLSLFSFTLRSGNRQSALEGVDGLVLTERSARQLFGEKDPLGSSVEVRLGTEYSLHTVTGVVLDPPANSTIRFDVLLPIEPWIQSQYPDAQDSFGWSLVETYVELGQDALWGNVNDGLNEIYEKYNGEYMQVLRERYDLASTVRSAGYQAVPISEVYLSRFSDPMYSFILSAIGMGILLIACINFMTMAIGRSLSRSREVGIRKVVGAVRTQLVGQFWGEAVVLTLMSTGLGLLIAWRALPFFNQMTDKRMSFDLLADWTIPVGIGLLILFTGLISGSYPAVVLSSFRPVDVLKNKIRVSGSNAFTKALVTLQFALSVTLIISMLVMKKQMDHLRSRDLGFRTEQTVLVELNGLDGPAVARQFRERLGERPEILGISTAANALGYRGSTGMAIQWEGDRVNIDMLSIDHEFLDQMGIGLIAGRAFDIDRPADSSGVVIVNQALVNRFGLTDPIGATIPALPAEKSPTIIGVTSDFNFQSLYQEVGPLMMSIENYWGFDYLYVRLAPAQFESALLLLKETWERVTADIPFSYEFLDDRMARVYATDRRWGNIINTAAGFAVLLALLGLFGLTSLAVKRRTKEFGIRKVLGASTGRLIRLITQEFARMIAIGSCIAVPVGVLIMNRWLDNFAFRTTIGVDIFLIAIGTVLLGALATIIGQSLRTASADPVEALSRE